MTAPGLSIHVGLNWFDADHYGDPGQLAGCENDARDMQSLAQSCGFETETLLTKEATSAAVIDAIECAGNTLSANGILFISYSGHGGQLDDQNSDEPDRKDETWCLFDRELVDDELYALWGRFQAGTRILVVSDSCHSGSVVKALPDDYFSEAEKAGCKVKTLVEPPARKVYLDHKAVYDAIQARTLAYDETPIDASVLLISGCQDNQLSADGQQNGAFTAALLSAWDGGSFQGNYRQFWKRIQEQLPREQSPNYFTAGSANRAFEGQRPFTIAE